MAIDRYPGSEAIDSPIDEFYAVIPGTGELPNGVPKAIYVGVAGHLNVVGKDQADGDAVPLRNVPVGWHPIRPKKILAIVGSATDIVAGY